MLNDIGHLFIKYVAKSRDQGRFVFHHHKKEKAVLSAFSFPKEWSLALLLSLTLFLLFFKNLK